MSACAPGAPEGRGAHHVAEPAPRRHDRGPPAAVFNWIAFGPGERRFGGGIALPFVAVSGPSSEWTGRAAFGIGAVLVDLFLVWFLERGLRDLLGRRH